MTPQAGILRPPSPHARCVVLGGDPRQLAPVAAGVPALIEQVKALDPDSDLTCVVGLGARCWDAVAPTHRPRHLRPFAPEADGLPSTGGDLLLHLTAERADLVAEVLLRLLPRIVDGAEVLEDVIGFRYLDRRDLTGFILGTANPEGPEAERVALIGEEDTDFAGGSYVFAQRWVHDLRAWVGLPTAEQEAIMGRRKADGAVLPEPEPSAHIRRAVLEVDGQRRTLLRRSTPYVTADEAGLLFLGYARDPAVVETILDRLLGGDGVRDRLMDYSTPVSGAHFFAPPVEVLTRLG